MEKVFTNLEHAEWLREQARLKRPYWYGTYHNKCTEALLKRKAKQYPEHYTEKRMPTYRKHIAAGQIAADCVNGAIKGAVWSELGKREPKYASHGCPDKSANGMFEYCQKNGMAWGKIDTMPDVIGLAVRFDGHVGVYVGNGEVVEWRGFSYGCVVTKLEKRKWTHWYELPWTDYVTGDISAAKPADKPTTQTQTNTKPTLRKGSKGESVKTLQDKLNKLGYNCGEVDGDFGSNTLKAVKLFQTDKGLEVDGIVGAKTWAALDEAKISNSNTPSRFVEIKGCTRCNARTGPGTNYKILGTANVGDKLVYGGQTAENGWHLVEFKNQNAWVSGKYGKLVDN